ncbi:hypothetical protein GH714_011539 [Hevea brasiliensis]|uniref:Major facilitator superfamily (MFS) profile domain-containing protein n=1 Tax=Hevea brasiliensis TaxID=3981 RepID=A0A6A6M4N6_HEVBR|nr:hypothetical protein GH714_011539 [Hevea brasiliensis]
MAGGQRTKGLNKSCFLLIVIAGIERFAFKGVASNLVTYLTDVVKMSNSAAAKTVNNWCGFTSMLPLLVASLADSCWDKYPTILASSFIYVVGLVALTSTELTWSWYPSNNLSFSFLFCSLCLVSLGQGGYNPSLQAFGADQLESDDELPCSKDDQKSNKKSLFFKWWYFGVCGGSLLGVTVMSYIQDTFGWVLGFTIPTIAMVSSIGLFWCGSRMLQEKPLCPESIGKVKGLNDNSFENAKQGVTMKRNIGSNFKIPPATLQSSITVSIILLMPLYDTLFIPIIRIITRDEKGINVMQRMGIGMVLSIIAMVIAALVETKRLEMSQKMPHSETVPLSIFWLLPQYILLGISDIFTVVGMQEFFYSEVPGRMKTMGIALYTSVFGVGSFLGALLISLVEIFNSSRGRQSWFSDDMKEAHLDKYYWLLALLSALSMLLYVILCKFYRSE